MQQILELYSDPIADFDLSQFRSEEEIKILQDDYCLDVIVNAASILTYVATNEVSNKLSNTNMKQAVFGG